jgi:outer membrane receptor for ferrienterochelin and colicins
VVTPMEARDPTDVLLSFRNFGIVRVWGVDVAVTGHLGENVAVTATYSWVSRDLFPSPAGWPEDPLNAPRAKGAVSLAYVRPQGPVSGELRGRSVRGFPARSGVYSGRVASYSVVDAAVGTRLPRAPRVEVTLTVQNLLDHRHRQFVGAPELGRLALLRTRIHL